MCSLITAIQSNKIKSPGPPLKIMMTQMGGRRPKYLFLSSSQSMPNFLVSYPSLSACLNPKINSFLQKVIVITF